MGILNHSPQFFFRRSAAALLLGVCSMLALSSPSTVHAQAVEVGFSPEGTAEELVIKTIFSAKQSIRLAAYSLTSPRVVGALIAAKRGQYKVDIQVVADWKNNVEDDRSGKARKALDLLKSAGIPVRLNSSYSIHHDKFIVVDSTTVQTGSFNYSQAAARYNSENVVVIYGQPRIAAQFLGHWRSRFDQAAPY